MKREYFLRTIFCTIAFLLLVKLFIPIIKPIAAAADLSYDRMEFFKSVIARANPVMETYIKVDKEDNRELYELIFKYLTNIDIKNPKTYIASQFPVLGLFDVNVLMPEESRPKVSILPDNKDNNDNSNDNKDINKEEPVKEEIPDKIIPTGKDVSIPKGKLDPAKPIILIFHTHATESFNPNQEKDKDFTIDSNMNNIKIGEELKKELEEKYGLSCIHDMTYHDIPVRDYGYSKSKPTVEKYLKKYPSLKLIIDLHRDGDVPRTRSVAMLDKEVYAKTLLVVGTKNKNFKDLNSLAVKINSLTDSMYPGLSRGIMQKKSMYNQYLSSKMILLEMGSNICSIDEVLRTSRIMGKVIAAYINGL